MALKSDKNVTYDVNKALADLHKDYGLTVADYGGKPLYAERIPTGMFEFDLATGGGFPRGRVSIVYGPESSNKTNLVLLAIAQHQKKWPDLTNAFIDVENSLDRDWAMKLGVNMDKVLYVRPSYAEQAIDVMEKLFGASDIGIVALDSLAAMSLAQEQENSAEKGLVGAQGLIGNRLFRRLGQALMDAEKEDRHPTFLVINQVRSKVGIVYGNPETRPGGKGQDFASNLTVRVSGKNVMDPKVNKAMPVRKETTFTIIKNKVPIFAINGKFELVTYPHGGLTVGQCDDVGTIQAYLEEWGEWKKDKKGWEIIGEVYPTQKAFQERFYGDLEFGDQVRQSVVAKIMSDNNLLMSGDGVDVE